MPLEFERELVPKCDNCLRDIGQDAAIVDITSDWEVTVVQDGSYLASSGRPYVQTWVRPTAIPYRQILMCATCQKGLLRPIQKKIAERRASLRAGVR